MINLLKVVQSLVIVISLSLSGIAQNMQRVGEKIPSTKTPSANDNEIEKRMNSPKELTVDQQHALFLLGSLFEKAKDFEDEQIKIRIQSQIADAIWSYDESRARSQFKEAFQAIDLIKVTPDQVVRHQDPVVAILSSPQFKLRQEVLRIISQHDFAFAETLRSSIKSILDTDISGVGLQSDNYEQMVHSLLLAATFAKDNPERVGQIVRAGLQTGIHEMLVATLIGIRRENPALANSLFSEALLVAKAAPSSGSANIGSLAYYIFPTEEDVLFGRDPTSDPTRRATIEQFLNFVYETILSQVGAKSKASPISGRAMAQRDYMVLQQIMPFFDKLIPDKASIIRNRLSQLADNISLQQLSALESMNRQTSLQDLLKRAESSSNPWQKNVLYAQAAMAAFRQDDIDQALAIAEKISNEQDRLSITSNIQYQAALKALNKEDVDAAYHLAKDIPLLAERVEIFDRMAKSLLDKQENSRAADLLSEVEDYARRSDSEPQKARALLRIASTFAGFDSIRGFEVTESAVKAINDADFNPPVPSRDRTLIKRIPVTIEMLDFKSIFSLLARSDFERALLLAQSIEKKEASMLAQIAVCRELLNNLQINKGKIKASQDKYKPSKGTKKK